MPPFNSLFKITRKVHRDLMLLSTLLPGGRPPQCEDFQGEAGAVGGDAALTELAHSHCFVLFHFLFQVQLPLI